MNIEIQTIDWCKTSNDKTTEIHSFALSPALGDQFIVIFCLFVYLLSLRLVQFNLCPKSITYAHAHKT